MLRVFVSVGPAEARLMETQFYCVSSGQADKRLPAFLELRWAAAGDEVEPACSQG